MSLLPIINEPQNSGLGDSLKVSFDKVKANFIYLDEKFSGYVDLSSYNTQIDALETSINNILIGYSQIGHTHVISDINNLQNSLNQLVKITTYTVDISSIQNELSSINTILNTIIGEIDDIFTSLNTKIGEAPIDGITYARKDGDWVTITSGGGGVPYTGATQDVNLGEFGLLTGNLEFDTTPTNVPTTAGSMYWNDTDGTLDLKLKGGNVTLQVGQETVVRVVNKTATNISLLEANYQAVRLTGAQGQRLKVDLAIATNDLSSAETIGLVTETIPNNQEGFVTTSGIIRGINTTGNLQGEAWVDGDVLYLSPITAGRVTKVKPIAPQHLVIIGYVVNAHITQGTIFVKVDNGYELEELHNVSAVAPNNNEALVYESATSLWKPKTVATALGYTPANANEDLVNRRLGYTVSTELLSPLTAQLAPYGFTSVLGGGLALVNNIIDANHPGVQQIASQAGNANSGGFIATHGNTNSYSTRFTDGLQTDLIFKLLPNPTNNYIRFGNTYGSIVVNAPSYGNYFEINETTIAGITRNFGVQSSTSTFTLTADTWYHLRLKESVVDGTNTVTFTVYNMIGTELFNQLSTTNIQSTTTRTNVVFGVNKVSAVATSIIYVDYIGLTFPSMIRGALN
jgi:hypothetical protein